MGGGVVFRVLGELFFLPAEIACKIIPTPSIARMPGGPPALRGVALVDGDMIAVVDIGDLDASLGVKNAMLVCDVLGERVGLVGMEIVATGTFRDATSGGSARTFDVAGAIARVREGHWGV